MVQCTCNQMVHQKCTSPDGSPTEYISLDGSQTVYRWFTNTVYVTRWFTNIVHVTRRFTNTVHVTRWFANSVHVTRWFTNSEHVTGWFTKQSSSVHNGSSSNKKIGMDLTSTMLRPTGHVVPAHDLIGELWIAYWEHTVGLHVHVNMMPLQTILPGSEPAA